MLHAHCLIDFSISLDGENSKELVGISSTYASPERQDARLSIEERSIARIIYTFLENLKISAFVKTKEESLQYLRDVYEEYGG